MYQDIENHKIRFLAIKKRFSQDLVKILLLSGFILWIATISIIFAPKKQKIPSSPRVPIPQ